MDVILEPKLPTKGCTTKRSDTELQTHPSGSEPVTEQSSSASIKASETSDTNRTHSSGQSQFLTVEKHNESGVGNEEESYKMNKDVSIQVKTRVTENQTAPGNNEAEGSKQSKTEGPGDKTPELDQNANQSPRSSDKQNQKCSNELHKICNDDQPPDNINSKDSLTISEQEITEAINSADIQTNVVPTTLEDGQTRSGRSKRRKPPKKQDVTIKYQTRAKNRKQVNEAQIEGPAETVIKVVEPGQGDPTSEAPDRGRTEEDGKPKTRSTKGRKMADDENVPRKKSRPTRDLQERKTPETEAQTENTPPRTKDASVKDTREEEEICEPTPPRPKRGRPKKKTKQEDWSSKVAQEEKLQYRCSEDQIYDSLGRNQVQEQMKASGPCRVEEKETMDEASAERPDSVEKSARNTKPEVRTPNFILTRSLDIK